MAEDQLEDSCQSLNKRGQIWAKDLTEKVDKNG